MSNLFFSVLYQPIFNLLIFFYNLIPDIGISIIIITLIIKIITWPLSKKSLRSQRAMQTLQPKLEALKQKYKNDKEKLGIATMELYKAEKINPLSSCLPLLIQLPIIFAMFQVFRTGLVNADFSILYNFVSIPEKINPIMLGFLDLSRPQVILGVLAGGAQFWHTQILRKKNGNVPKKENKKEPAMTEVMSKQMMYFMPFLTIIFSTTLPGGVVLYWLINTFLMAFEQKFVNQNLKKEKEETKNILSENTKNGLAKKDIIEISEPKKEEAKE